MAAAAPIRRWLAGLALLALVSALAWLLHRALYIDKRELPSPLIGQPLPASLFALPALDGDSPAPAELAQRLEGRAWLLCVWASWCLSCIDDQPIFRKIKDEHKLALVGLNYIDETAAAQRWLSRHGDPFDYQFRDIDGLGSIDFGVYGVPETYIIDASGIVRERIVGALSEPARLARLYSGVRKYAQR